MTLKATIILAIIISAMSVSAVANDKVADYPDPGYTLLAGYRSSHPDYFDYSVGNILNLPPEVFPDKKQWWAEYRKKYQTNPSFKYTIFSAYFGLGAGLHREEGLTPARIKARLDSFFSPEPGIPTYPELMHGFCISEENAPWINSDLMDFAARYIMKTYGIPAWQWMTPPGPPVPSIAASGWVYNEYGMRYDDFRRLTMKYVSMDKPLHCMVWVADDPYIKYPDAHALINDTDEQLRVLKEFNIPVSFYAVANPGGSVGQWLGKDDALLRGVRSWAKQLRKEMHIVSPQARQPLDSANYSQGRPLDVGRPAPIPTVYEDSFEEFKLIEDASFTGFLDLKLTSEPEERPGFLLAKTHADRSVQASLMYEFKSQRPLTMLSVRLDAAAPAASNSRNEIALSIDKKDWSLSAEQSDCDAIKPVVLTADKDFFKGADTVYLRITMQNDAGADNIPANRLAHLRVACANQGVALWWNDWGTPQQCGPWAGHFHEDKDKDIDGDGKGGLIRLDNTGLNVWGTKRIDASAGKLLKDIVIDWGIVNAEKDRGGCWAIQASATGAFAGEEIQAVHNKGWERLMLDLRDNPEFEGIRSLYVRLSGSNSATWQSSYAGPITVIGNLIPCSKYNSR